MSSKPSSPKKRNRPLVEPSISRWAHCPARSTAASPSWFHSSGLATASSLARVADNEIVPAIGLAEDPESYPPSTHAYALASHLVYGFVTETIRTALRLVL